MKTVSVGIPAYNEEENIGELLKSVLNQKVINYKLEKIFVVNDGSRDKTGGIVKRLQNSSKKISLINKDKRGGQAEALNQIFKLSDSEILITFDADTVLADDDVIQKLIAEFDSPKVGLVGGNETPFPPANLIEKIGYVWCKVWFETRKDFNGGVTVHNHHNCISALVKPLYKKAVIPSDIISNDDFLYFTALLWGFQFRFSKKARVYYKLPGNLQDFLLQTARLITLKRRIAGYFGDWVYQYYQIPIQYKLKALLKVLINEPLILPLAIILQVFLRVFKKAYLEDYKAGYWTTIRSSK